MITIALVWWFIISVVLHATDILKYDHSIRPLQNPYKKAIAAFLAGPFFWACYLIEWLNQP